MSRTLSALVAALALPLAACDSFYVEAEQPLACLTLQPQSFTIPVVPVPGGFTGEWTGTTTVGIGDVLPGFILDGPPQDRRVQLVSFGLGLTSGATNLDWLKTLEVSVTGPGTVTPISVVSLEGGVPPGSRSINLPASNPGANLADYVSNGNLTLTYTGSAAVPAGSTIPTTWTGSVNLCIQAHVKKTFNQLINP
ncbi:MAG TPA: hypothetical protein VFM53_14040 [Anaeromyxobacteraceae bacterium]|nr:hypothetical protein [Anaeromyxobacteraceae bacterium]